MIRGNRITIARFVECLFLTASAYAQTESEKLHRLFAEEWEWSMETHPETATSTGYPGQDDRWTDMSADAIAARQAHERELVERIGAIDREALSAADQLNYDLFKKDAELAVVGQAFYDMYMPITQVDGVQQDMATTIDKMPADSMEDFQNILGRLEAMPERIRQEIALLQRGLELGATRPKITLRDVPDQVKNLISENPLSSPLLAPFGRMPESIAPTDRTSLTDAGKHIYSESVVPALNELHGFLVGTYIPRATETIAATELPKGKEWYAYRVRLMTTTTKSPQEIHDLGQSEVKRIRGEMERVIASVGFEGSFDEFLTYLRTDPKFYFDDPDELIRAYRDIAKRIDPGLIKLFGKLPRLPYGVEPTPAYAEKSQPTARYMPGSPQAVRPGFFQANTYDLKTRPKWEMEALTVHEAVPGHHLQIALAQEMEGVPEFRKWSGPTAFIEGWGLYAESLGGEIGMYADPYSKFGQLTYEMWRAVRLVVDTGMHAFGWSRQQAIDFFAANSSKPLHDITVEIDRYIVWPGQALAYKIGELKLKELRARAEGALGEKFDLRAFHDACLENGAIPLDILEAHIDGWIARQR